MKDYLRRQEENLIVVSTVEEYALKHQMKVPEVVRLFNRNKIPSLPLSPSA